MVALLVPVRHSGRESAMNLRTFAARLKELREAAQWSQKQLAEAAGVSQKAVSNWEQGEREPGWLAVLALARALGVDCRAFEQEPAEIPEPRRGRPPKAQPPTEPPPGRKGKGKPK